ncbi:MAG: tetratricopeptide repeat protein [Deltaproteobacteria bacterium]|nr:tetratricopeptide repeat protein [Deltaproteobacteria bacterium]
MLIRHGIPFFISLGLFIACSSTARETASTAQGLSWNVQELITASRNAAAAAEASEKRGVMKDEAETGIHYAERCLERAPEEAACFYYRAINTGLYYQARVVGYQTGVKHMAADLERVIAINALYDYAGAHRALGELFTKLPQTTVHPNDLRRDLEKAENYLREAVRLAPDYPENYLQLSETLTARGKYDEAQGALSRAKELVPRWKRDRAYGSWQSATSQLETKLAVIQR